MISGTGPSLLGLLENGNPLLLSPWHLQLNASNLPQSRISGHRFPSGYQLGGFNAVPIASGGKSRAPRDILHGTAPVLPDRAVPWPGWAPWCEHTWALDSSCHMSVLHLSPGTTPELQPALGDAMPSLWLLCQRKCTLNWEHPSRTGEEEEAQGGEEAPAPLCCELHITSCWISGRWDWTLCYRTCTRRWYPGEANLQQVTLKNPALECKKVYLDWEGVCEVLCFCWSAGKKAVSKGWLLKWNLNPSLTETDGALIVLWAVRSHENVLENVLITW